MKWIYITLTLVIFLFGSVQSQAQVERVTGSRVEKNVTRITSIIDWKDSIDELKTEAQRRNKMMFWLQIVGDLDGGL